MKFINAIAIIATLILTGCDNPGSKAMEPQVEIIVNTDEGTVVGHKTSVEEFPQQIASVGSDVCRQFSGWSEESKSFISSYIEPSGENELKRYDQAFRAWQMSSDKKYSNQQVVEYLGAYLGQRLIDDLNMEWVLVTDQYGTDYAVRHKESEVMSFPFSSVLKRIEANEFEFMHGVYHVIKHQLETEEFKKHN